MDGPMNMAELRLQLEAEIERTEASVEFWRNQMHLQTDTPFEMAVGQTLQSYKAQVSELIKARKFLDNA